MCTQTLIHIIDPKHQTHPFVIITGFKFMPATEGFKNLLHERRLLFLTQSLRCQLLCKPSNTFPDHPPAVTCPYTDRLSRTYYRE